MNCPNCKSPIADKLILSEGAKLMRAKSKRKYTSEQGRKAVEMRWKKYYENQDSQAEKLKDVLNYARNEKLLCLICDKPARRIDFNGNRLCEKCFQKGEKFNSK